MARELERPSRDVSARDFYLGDLLIPGAFGDPDGKTADPGEFVSLDRDRGFGDLASGDLDARVRILVGRKGAGKTVYMRRLKQSAERERSVLVAEEMEQTQLPQTAHVVRVAHWFDPDLLTEAWMSLWNRAILYSLASYVLRHQGFRSHVDEDDLERLERDYAPLLLTLGPEPRSPFTTVRELIHNHRTAFDLETTLDDPLWDDLERTLARILDELPPIFFYLDAIDEVFEGAPMYWLRCQKGLFYQVMRLLRSGRFGGRLHIIVCVRDLVLSSVFRTEHAPRYRTDSHLRVLNWTNASIRYLLEYKIGHLRHDYFAAGRGRPKSLPEWVGLQRVENRRGQPENVTEYALRHMQPIPRDVVILGNELGRLLAARRRSGEAGALDAAEFKAVVSKVALAGGLTQIKLCANQLVSEVMPVEASKHDFASVYVATDEYSTTYAERLLGLLESLSGLRVTRDEIIELTDRTRREFETRSDIASILWQNGLLGYNDGQADIFYSLDEASRFKLPQRVDEYVFHPSMYECAGLQGTDRPVVPF